MCWEGCCLSLSIIGKVKGEIVTRSPLSLVLGSRLLLPAWFRSLCLSAWMVYTHAYTHTHARTHTTTTPQEFSERRSQVVSQILRNQILLGKYRNTGKVSWNMNSIKHTHKNQKTLQISHSELISKTKKPFGHSKVIDILAIRYGI